MRTLLRTAIGSGALLTLLSGFQFGCLAVVAPAAEEAANVIGDGGATAENMLADPAPAAPGSSSSNPTSANGNSTATASSVSSGNSGGASPTPTSGGIQNPPAGTDLNGDGVLTAADVDVLRTMTGPAGAGANNGDYNHDGVVDLKDISYLLSLFK